MATDTKKHYIVPIGCSCITQFQLNFAYTEKQYVSQIFDWNLFTPDSLINILESNFESLANASENIQIHLPGIVKAGNLPGYYWWHANKIIGENKSFQSIEEFEEKIGSAFRSKLHYQIDKFMNISDSSNLVFIWSNAQPNLKKALTVHWESNDFNLTNNRYQKICSLIKGKYPNSTVKFAVREEITDKEILCQEDVYVINVPISDEYEGDKSLFTEAGILEATHRD